MKKNRNIDSIRVRLLEALHQSPNPPKNYQEFCEWERKRLYDAELEILKKQFQENEDGHREWVFDLCVESGKFEQVDGDLRLKSRA